MTRTEKEQLQHQLLQILRTHITSDVLDCFSSACENMAELTDPDNGGNAETYNRWKKLTFRLMDMAAEALITP